MKRIIHRKPPDYIQRQQQQYTRKQGKLISLSAENWLFPYQTYFQRDLLTRDFPATKSNIFNRQMKSCASPPDNKHVCYTLHVRETRGCFCCCWRWRYNIRSGGEKRARENERSGSLSRARDHSKVLDSRARSDSLSCEWTCVVGRRAARVWVREW